MLSGPQGEWPGTENLPNRDPMPAPMTVTSRLPFINRWEFKTRNERGASEINAPCPSHKGAMGEEEVKLHPFLTSVLYEVG